MTTLHPEVVAEFEAELAARCVKSAELSVIHRVNALETRLHRLEAVPPSNSAPSLDEDFWTEATAAFRGFVEDHVNKLKAEIIALKEQIAKLEAKSGSSMK